VTTPSSRNPRKEEKKLLYSVEVLDDTEGAQANLADEGKLQCI
jgi:hypothetical protein